MLPRNRGVCQLAYFQSGGWGSCWTSSATPDDDHHPAYTAPPDLWASDAPWPGPAVEAMCAVCLGALESRHCSTTVCTPSKGIDAVVLMPFFFNRRAPAWLLEPELLARRDVDPNPPRESTSPARQRATVSAEVGRSVWSTVVRWSRREEVLRRKGSPA
jgi:hypothetical protein